MKIIKEWVNLIFITFGITLLFCYMFSILANGFDFSNFFAKFFVFIFIFIIITGIVRLTLWDKEFRNGNLISMFLFGMFWVLFAANMFFGEAIYKTNKEYVGLSVRETNNEDYVIATDYGERGEVYEYKDYYYLDPTIKDYVINKNSPYYGEIKKTLRKNNEHVGEKKYIYWESAVVDGFSSKNSSNSFEMGFYYFLELCHKIIPTLFFVLILNFIFQIFFRFKYSLLDAIYHRNENLEKIEEDEEMEKFWADIRRINKIYQKDR